MKPLLATASALTLMFSAAACSQANDNIETAGYETAGEEQAMTGEDDDQYAQTEAAVPVIDEPEMDETDTRVDRDSDREAYVLAAGEIEASDLIGAPVTNPTGDEIATVADVFFGEDLNAPKLIVRDGGLTGLGGDLRSVAFDGATFTPTEAAGGDEPEVTIQQNGASIETLPPFEQEGLNDYRLASELMGTTGSLSFSGDSVRIEDFILTASGEPRYAVLSDGVIGGNGFIVPAEAITVAQGDGEGDWIINLEESEVNAARGYRWN